MEFHCPGKEQLRRLPLWARVALAARTTRRALPLLHASWPEAPLDYWAAIEWAISESEWAASRGRYTDRLWLAGMAAMEVYGSDCKSSVPNYLAFAASRVSFSGHELEPSDSVLAIENTEWAVHFYDMEAEQNEVQTEFAAAVQLDCDYLAARAESEKWDDGSPMPADLWGSFWEEAPSSWPALFDDNRLTAVVAELSKRSSPPRPRSIPKDLRKFLTEHQDQKIVFPSRCARYVEVKAIEFFLPNELWLTVANVHTWEYYTNYGEPGEDPELTYDIEIVSLLRSAGDYSAHGILCWVPLLSQYASFDNDHGKAYLFGAHYNWSIIQENLGVFVNSGWNKDPGIDQELFRPWDDPRCAQLKHYSTGEG